MRSFAFTSLAALAGLALAAAPAAAHALWISPTPRSGADYLTTGPCGGVAPTGNPTVYQAGSTITVKWQQDIDHQGTYRIAFSPANDQGFDQNILADNIPDQSGGGVTYAHQVTLPSTPCTGCTLQLIQQGTDSPGHYYYSCADIELTSGPVPDAYPGGGTVDAGGSGGGTVDAASQGGGYPDAQQPADYVDAGSTSGGGNMSGGCAVAVGTGQAPGGAGALSLLTLALAALWLCRRRTW